jgi:hypothetical protein
MILGLARRAVAIVLRPAEAWDSDTGVGASPLRLTLTYVLPLSLIPAIAWVLAGLHGEIDLAGRGRAAIVPAHSILVAGVVTLCASIASVWALAAVLRLLAPFGGGRRDFSAAFRVAAFGATPLWVAGITFLIPMLTLFFFAALFEVLLLYINGLQDVLGVRAEDAGPILALALMLVCAASVLAGGALSAAGLI